MARKRSVSLDPTQIAQGCLITGNYRLTACVVTGSYVYCIQLSSHVLGIPCAPLLSGGRSIVSPGSIRGTQWRARNQKGGLHCAASGALPACGANPRVIGSRSSNDCFRAVFITPRLAQRVVRALTLRRAAGLLRARVHPAGASGPKHCHAHQGTLPPLFYAEILQVPLRYPPVRVPVQQPTVRSLECRPAAQK